MRENGVFFTPVHLSVVRPGFLGRTTYCRVFWSSKLVKNYQFAASYTLKLRRKWTWFIWISGKLLIWCGFTIAFLRSSTLWLVAITSKLYGHGWGSTFSNVSSTRTILSKYLLNTYQFCHLQPWQDPIMTTNSYRRQLQIFIFSPNRQYLNGMISHKTPSTNLQLTVSNNHYSIIFVHISTHAPGGLCWLK